MLLSSKEIALGCSLRQVVEEKSVSQTGHYQPALSLPELPSGIICTLTGVSLPNEAEIVVTDELEQQTDYWVPI